MTDAELSEKLRDLLPAGVCVAAGEALATPLTARERASLGEVTPDRLREFESGRAYAKRALAALGVAETDLPIGPNRAPVWPAGVTGSISHVRCGREGIYAAAAAARTGVALAVGIDIEAEDRLEPDLWPYVLTQRELKRLLALPSGARRREVAHIWCAKEVAAKIFGYPFDPAEIEIERDPGSDGFSAGSAPNARWLGRWAISGRTASLERLVLAAAVVPAADAAQPHGLIN